MPGFSAIHPTAEELGVERGKSHGGVWRSVPRADSRRHSQEAGALGGDIEDAMMLVTSY